MTSRVCSKNKEKKAERKNSVKKIDQTGKKKLHKETESMQRRLESKPVYLLVQETP